MTHKRRRSIVPMSFHVYDCVHGTIQFTKEEWDIVNHPLFQRLKGLHQLGCAFYVFPSATHTRYDHSLGAFHVAGLYAEKLFPNNLKKRKLIKISALLHDIAHGPFSHLWDKVVYSKKYPGVEKGHDEHRHELICNETYGIKQLIDKCGITSKQISDIWRDEGEIKDIIQGSLGADRLDYLLRDTYHLSSSVPNICDFTKLMYCVLDIVDKSYIDKQGALCYGNVPQDYISLILDHRQWMYKNIYLHPNVLLVDNTCGNMVLQLINLLSNQDDLDISQIENYSLTEEFIFNSALIHGINIEFEVKLQMEKNQLK